MRAYQKCQQLKKQIKCLGFDYHFDQSKAEWATLDDAQVKELHNLQVAAVVSAKQDDPDLDFGSLDHKCADINEPCIEFDPDKDTSLTTLSDTTNLK